MSRAVYVGGFGNGRASAKKVGNALGAYFDYVDTFTFSDLFRKPGIIKNPTHNSTLITHSAGALALLEPDLTPNRILLLNPPLPASLPKLLGRSAVKTARMYTPGLGINNPGDLLAASSYSRSLLAEMISHPLANLSRLPNVAHFDTISAAIKAKSEGQDISLVWTAGDAYFSPSNKDFDMLAEHSIPVSVVGGEHDEIVLRPSQLIAQVL